MKRKWHSMSSILAALFVLTCSGLWGCTTLGTRAQPLPSDIPSAADSATGPIRFSATRAQSSFPQDNIPPCSFAASNIPPATSTLVRNEYTFSEPTVVLTHSSAIGIQSWLPDSQRLLLTRHRANTRGEAIDVFDVTARTMHSYGERQDVYGQPVWIDAQQAVGFVENTREEGAVLRVSYGSVGTIETPEKHLLSTYLSVHSVSQTVSVILADAQNQLQVASLDLQKGTLLSLYQQTLSPRASSSGQAPIGFGDTYRLSWSPTGQKLVYYNTTGFYLFDAATQQVCRIDLGSDAIAGKRWAFDAQWSPDERFIALRVTAGELPLSFIDLTLLDIATGAMRSAFPETSSKVQDIAWSPDSRHILVLATPHSNPQGTPGKVLLLTPVNTLQFERLFPERLFGGSGWGDALAWSFDGKQVAVLCPDIGANNALATEDRLCLINVNRS